MKRKMVSAIVLTLLLTSMLTLAFNLQPVRATGTVYIRADGSIDPPTAPIQRNGDTYTLTDNINDSIVVEKNHTIIDGSGYVLQGFGSGDGFHLSCVSNVTIQRTRIQEFYRGIYLYYSSDCIVSRNSMTNNSRSIELHGASNNALSENNVTNSYDGVLLYGSSNSVYGNNLTNNDCGIWLLWSSNNLVSANAITNNNLGMWFYISSNDTVSGNNLTNNVIGIDAYGSSSNISGNNITTNSHIGILLHESSNNILRNNNLTSNRFNLGVQGGNLSHYIQDIDGSNTVNGKPVCYWINETNEVIPIDAGYVALVNCTNITIKNLSLWNNWQGILLAYTVNSTIADNNIAYNRYGILLDESSDNSLCHNGFVNNIEQARFFESGFANSWDDGYPSGGNYWSDNAGFDFYSGPYQNETGSDSLGDTPYIVNQDNIDRYPLVGHDIAVGNVSTSKSGCIPKPIVCQGYTARVLVTVVNQGGYTETFNVTAYATNATSSYIIGKVLNEMLNQNESTVLTMVWNTSGFAKGNYTISAIADTVPAEVHTEDNVFIGDTLEIVLVGDVCPTDGYVGIDDIYNIASHFGAEPGDPRYNPNKDITDDGYIGIDDIFIAATHFGQEDP